jgi:hypothetical protein
LEGIARFGRSLHRGRQPQSRPSPGVHSCRWFRSFRNNRAGNRALGGVLLCAETQAAEACPLESAGCGKVAATPRVVLPRAAVSTLVFTLSRAV